MKALAILAKHTTATGIEDQTLCSASNLRVLKLAKG